MGSETLALVMAALVGVSVVAVALDQGSADVKASTGPQTITTQVSGVQQDVPPGWGPYVVQKGDTLYALAAARGTSVARIAEVNKLADISTIRAGQVLLLPNAAKAAEKTDPSASRERDPLASRGGDPFREITGAAPTPAGPSGSGGPLGITLTPEQQILLARLVQAEAGGEPLDGQIAVAAVVLNRMRSPRFPKTLEGVIYQPGQFLAVEKGKLPAQPGSTAMLAVQRALAGDDPSGGALFFYNPAATQAPGFWNGRSVTAKIGNHIFTR